MSMEIGNPPGTQPAVEIEVGEGPAKVVAVVVPESPTAGLSWWKVAVLIALPLALVAYVYLAAQGVHLALEYKKPAPPAPVVAEGWEPDGPALFAQHCARCHGPTGNGDGFASLFLDPPARRFGREKFALATTVNRIPTDDDLMYVIRHGIPGTSMPAFEHLTTDADRRALAGHVRRLAYSGLYAALYKRFKDDGEEPDVVEVSVSAAKQLVPGDPLHVPNDLPEPDADSIARGQARFTKDCATCHGPQGKGDGPQVKDMKNDNGWPTKPRDLARGVFKGGGERDRLYARIFLGMPGTPMPASNLPPRDLGDLVNYVLSLSGRDAEAGN
jgi:mono/diheme cytochrome c family protein